MNIKKGDNVIVITGKDRGKKAKVLKVVPREDRVVLEGTNLRKVHHKPRRQGEKGQIINMPAPMHLSNIQLFCSSCDRGRRTAVEVKGGKKLRVCVNCKKEI